MGAQKSCQEKVNQFMLLTSKLTSAQVAEMLVWYVNFSPIQDLYSHLDDYNSTFFQIQQRKHSTAYSALPF